MMYNNKLVACLKANGKILREFNKDTVYMPFGTEYSVFLKNLNSVRAIVNVQIDGKDMTEDGLVINANSELDLERSINNNILDKGNRFKFIERTAGVEAHRGVKAEDGIVRIEFQFEKVFPATQWIYHHHYYQPPVCPSPTWPSWTTWTTNNTGGVYGSVGGSIGSGPIGGIYGSSGKGSCAGSVNVSNTNAEYSAANMSQSCVRGMSAGFPQNSLGSAPVNDAGITVPGSVSDQQFMTVSSFPTEDEKHVIVLRVLGVTDKGKAIYAPVSVKQKPRCTTCNHQNKATANFCIKCGTALEIIA